MKQERVSKTVAPDAPSSPATPAPAAARERVSAPAEEQPQADDDGALLSEGARTEHLRELYHQDPLRAAVTATEGQALGDEHVHLAHAFHGLTRGERQSTWAMPYLENVARMGWWEQYGRHDGLDLADAPQDYLDTWIDAWSGGDADIPFARELNQQMNGLGLRSPDQGRGGFHWQTAIGADDLAPEQRYANDCGISAARAMMRATGVDADHEALFDDAVRGSYHSGRRGGQWNGPDRHVDFLRRHGVDAYNAGGLNWSKVDAELAAGRPVVLSTYAHYFVISGRDPATGLYNTGATGEEVNDRSYWSRGELSSYSTNHTLIAMRSLERIADPVGPATAIGPERITNPRHVVAQNGNATGFEAALRNGTSFQGMQALVSPALRVDGSSPEAFVQSVLPYARQVEGETGIPASIMVSMAAIETGYGRYALGNNLFGIKADPAWSGPTTGAVGTWEDYGNGPVQIRDTFRAYADPADSFRDFVRFLRENPRYSDALQVTGNPVAFIQGLRGAGYATDRDYVGKILSIARTWGLL